MANSTWTAESDSVCFNVAILLKSRLEAEIEVEPT